MKYICFLAISISFFSFSWQHDVLAIDKNNNAAVQDVIKRVIGKKSSNIKLVDSFRSDTSDAFQVNADKGIVTIYGNSPIAFTRGFYHYLKNACNVQITWAGQNLNLPQKLPDYKSEKIISPYPLRLYYNVCTFGYTTAFWDWERWERELDWMALHGINMPLAMNGQEAIWQKVWNSYGITSKALEDYFTGPAFLPWHRMGNINKHGGPLPQAWIDNNKELQKKILKRMRELGMKPVVPAFSGFVPPEFGELHKDASVINIEPWTGFSEDCGTFILHPSSKYFKEIGKKFIEEYKKEFGEAEYYLADSFNELKVPVNEENRYSELADFGKAVYESIQAGDENGTWVMQGWLFYFTPEFWDKPSVEALLSKVPDDKMIIIDLANEFFQGAAEHNSFHGKKWIYSIIHNFGGSTKLFGKLDYCAAHPSEIYNSPSKGNLSGFGISPEGIENNEVIYELLTDAAWTSNSININNWLKKYCLSRYGTESANLVKAWSLLEENLYTSFGLTNVFMFQWQPSLSLRLSNADPPELLEAAKLFLTADTLKDNPLYKNDLIDIIANLTAYKIDRLLKQFIQMQKLGESVERTKAFHEAKRLAYKLDDLLDLQESKRLTSWIKKADNWGNTPEDKLYYESNAKRQVTVWGGPDLSEYAAKIWSGLVKDYYFKRWEIFYNNLRSETTTDLNEWEENWINTPYTRDSKDLDLISLAKEIVTDIEKINLELTETIFKLSGDEKINKTSLQQGLTAQYFEGSWEMLPDFSKESAILDTVVNSINMDISKRNNDFGIRFTGVLKINEAGKYTFYLQSDDGSKLYLNNKELIDNDGLHAPDEQICEVELEPGLYNFRVDYFQQSGGRTLKLFYKNTDIPKTEVPAEMFFHQQESES